MTWQGEEAGLASVCPLTHQRPLSHLFFRLGPNREAISSVPVPASPSPGPSRWPTCHSSPELRSPEAQLELRGGAACPSPEVVSARVQALGSCLTSPGALHTSHCPASPTPDHSEGHLGGHALRQLPPGQSPRSLQKAPVPCPRPPSSSEDKSDWNLTAVAL